MKGKIILGGLAAAGFGFAIWSAKHVDPVNNPQLWNIGSPIDAPHNVVSSSWGDSRAYRANAAVPNPIHQGIDFLAPKGTPIRSVADGVVASVLNEPTTVRGLWVSIKHADGLISQYVHLDSAGVTAGQRVTRGQVIARSGNSGSRAGGSFGEHLHFTLRVTPAMIGTYAKRYGTPVGGFGTNAFGGIAVPAEPLVPAVYPATVVASARARGVSAPRGAIA